MLVVKRNGGPGYQAMAKSAKKKAKTAPKSSSRSIGSIALRTNSGRILLPSPAKSARSSRKSWSKAFERA
jgi:hypothetical protein